MPTTRKAKRLEEIKSRKVQYCPSPVPAKNLAPTALMPEDCSPTIYGTRCRDNRSIMDVAVFRLSKGEKRPNTTITYHLPDGFIRVMSGPLGMASAHDYDLVLMAASHLTEGMNRFREGKGQRPDQVFKTKIKDVLKFCRRDDGGKQREAVISALDRLSTTQVKIERVRDVRGVSKLITEGENLIGPFKVISHVRTKRLESLEFRIADWMYEEITQGLQPDVLSVNPDYFLLESGLARYLYRLARKTAGTDTATWSFGLLYERSGSDSKRIGFNRMLRNLIKKDVMPDYSLAEVQGAKDSMLRMVNRALVERWKAQGE